MGGLVPGSAIVAVLFTDLVGSTTIHERLGDERAHELWNEHGTLLGGVVAEHGGTVVKTLGDGLMAVFAAPSAALACAVAAQQEVSARNRRAPEPLSMRVGLSAGEVTIEETDVFGRPVIEAARLCAAAHGGQVLASDLVRTLAGSRVGPELGERMQLTLKGLGDVEVREVHWTDDGQRMALPPEATRDESRAFVGRAGEQEHLRAAWDTAVATEQCQALLLRGEPGIGKTRLALQFARSVHAEGAVVLYGHFDESLGFAFQPFVEALRHYVRESRPAGLPRRLGPFAGELTRLVPELEARVPGLPPRLRADPDMETLRLYDAVAAWLSAASQHEPVLLVVDDLQWASRPTFLLLRHILRATDPMRLLVVATYRDTDVDRDHPLRAFLADAPRWMPSLERVALAGLDPDAVEALVTESLGGPLDARGRNLAAALCQESGGNPFFLAELVRHLVDSGAFVRRNDRWTFNGELADVGMPESLRDALMGHLRRVSPSSFAVLSKAAVLGEQFDSGVLQSVADVDDATLGQALDEAVDHRFVDEPAVPHDPYRFSHALVRSALYDDLSASRRVALHRRALDALEALGPRSGDRVDELAHHAWQSAGAGDTGRALDYTLRAADRAAQHLAHDEAATWYRRALGLLDASGSQDSDRRFRLLMVLGESEQRAGLASSRETLLDAAGLAKLRGDAEGLAQAALANSRGFFSHTGRVDRERVAVLEDAIAAVDPEDGPMRARLLATLASELMWADDGDRRFDLSDEALAIARRLQDARTLAHVLILRSIAITAPDTLDTRVVDTGQLVQVAELLDDPVVHFHAAHAQLRLAVDIPDRNALDDALARMALLAEQLRQPALSWLAALALASDDFFRGDLDGAEKRALEGLRLGDRAGQPEAVMFGGAQLLFVRRLQGRLPELLDVAVAATDERGADYAQMVTLALCEAGRVDEARQRYERVASTGFDLRRDVVTGASLANLAHLASRLGDADGAAVLYERLAPYERTIFQAMNAMLVTHHYLGLLAVTLGRDADADHHFQQAVAVQRDLGAPLYVAETQLEWARALAQRGGGDNAERARTLATEARQAAGERGAVALERAAAAVLEGLRAPESS